MLREVAQNCRKFRSQTREISLRAAKLPQARGARQINKTLQVPFPTECCGTSKSSHLFVGSGGCDLACLRKHAEPGKSARRFKTSLRLTAAEQTTAQISSSHWVAATSDDAGKVFIQTVELRASSGMLYFPWFVTVSLAAASTGACHMSVLIEMYNFEKNLSTLRSQLVQ